MSWNTSEGVRVLKGPEKELFLCGAKHLYELILFCENLKEDGEPVYTDHCSEVFNSTTDEEKIVNLTHVVKELVNKTEPKELYAWSEAVVHAVFCVLKQVVINEIELYDPKADSPKFRAWKKRSLRYWLNECNTKYLNEEIKITGIKDPNEEAWGEIIECMQERILWDDDFNMQNDYLEASQECRLILNASLGIAPNYFVSVGLPASKGNVEKAHAYLEALES